MAVKRVAVIGAGIYGCYIALRLAKHGMAVSLFDPLGVLMAASAINQFRVHRGYHYPRSTETVREILAARTDFLREFAPAIVRNTEHYYAIPSAGSLTSPPEFERFCASFDLPIEAARPPWMNFDFIDRCYKVAEEIYDPDRLREILRQRLAAQKIDFIKSRFDPKQEDAFDHVVYATYGASGSHRLLFDRIRIQVAEKVLIKLPGALQRKALVVIDGPFTAFDSYKGSELGLFGSARFTNHWTTNDPAAEIPEIYRAILNKPAFEPVAFSRFEDLRADAMHATPAIAAAEYIGSKFTLRVVEDDPEHDRRILRVHRADERVFHVFSGKVVSAVNAAQILEKQILFDG